MTQAVHAIYADGILKPLTPLDLREHELVRLTISSLHDGNDPPQELAYVAVPARSSSQVLASFVRRGKGRPLPFDHSTMDPIDVD